MVCTVCNSPMADPVWPTTITKYCSRKCALRAFYLRNKETLLAKQALSYITRPKEVRAVKRRYNASVKGKAAQERYKQTHDVTAVYLAKYKSDVYVRSVQRSRELSREILLSVRPRVCELCGRTGSGRVVHCHHKDSNPFNRDVRNLQWLCIPCHTVAHTETDL